MTLPGMDGPKIWPYRPTALSAQAWFSLLNRQVFDGKLPSVTFLVTALAGAWAEYENGQITVADAFENHHQFIAVLAHEMVHHWQNVVHGVMDHGETFWAWERPLSDWGIDLKVHGDVHLDRLDSHDLRRSSDEGVFPGREG